MNFKSLLGQDMTVDIYDSNYSGSTPVHIIGGAAPFVTREYDDEDMYTPIRTQSGYLRMIVENASIVNEIQPARTTDRPVVLRNGNNILWVGFLKPEQYNQPWIRTPYEIELPLMSIMAAMQGVKFTQSEGYVSFFSLVRTINTYVPVDIYIYAPEITPVQDVYVQNNNFREFLTVAERSERGTTDIYECESLYDAIEAFCQYFGFSLHEYNGNFMCVVYPDTGIHYYEYEPGGDSQETQWGGVSLTSMTICGAQNLRNFSKMYRRIKGEFTTGTDKMDEVLDIDSFFKQFSVKGAYPTVAPNMLLFYGNSEIQPYKNGVQKAENFNTTSDSGGQIIRQRDERLNIAERNGSAWSDLFWISSKKDEANTPESAIKFNIPRKIYLNDDEYAALNIDATVLPYNDDTQGEGFIKKLHCKVKVGDYWLNIIEQSGYWPRYEWTTTESRCYLKVDESGNITMDGLQYTINWQANAAMDSINGFAIDLPAGLDPGNYSIYFELLANAEQAADFGEYSSIDYLVSGLTIRVLRGVNSVTEPTPNFDHNTIIRDTNGMYEDDYIVECPITSKRGVQYGAGMALTSGKAYVSTKYDQLGIVRRAAIMNKSREVLTVKVRNNTQPIDSVDYKSQTYGILSQSINWRDNENEIRIINLE
jgi:hypothetical protein